MTRYNTLTISEYTKCRKRNSAYWTAEARVFIGITTNPAVLTANAWNNPAEKRTLSGIS